MDHLFLAGGKLPSISMRAPVGRKGSNGCLSVGICVMSANLQRKVFHVKVFGDVGRIFVLPLRHAGPMCPFILYAEPFM